MKKKLLSALLCATMVAGLFAGCGNNGGSGNADPTQAAGGADGSEKITLSIYAQYADDDTKIPYDYAVEQLAIAYPNVELNLIVQAQDDGATLTTLANTHQLPDIYQSNSKIVNAFKETEQVMVLDDVAKSSGYLDKLMESNKSLAYDEDGHIYCFPYAGNEYVLMYYNKALFEQFNLEVPTTFDELKAVCKVFNENGIAPIELMAVEGWVSSAMFDIVATGFNAGGIKALDDGTTKVSDADYVAAAEALEDLAKNGVFQEGCTTTNYDTASSKFLNGEAAMFINGQWYIPDATAALGDNVDWMYYPAKDAATYEATKHAFAGGGSTSGFSVNAESENAELAAEVAAFMAEKYCEAKVLKRGTPLVALNVDVEPETEYPAMMKKLSDEIPNMTSTTQFTWGFKNATLADTLGQEAMGLVSGEYTAAEFVANVENGIQ